MSERELESSFLRHGAIAEFSKLIERGEKPPYEEYVKFMRHEIDPPIDKEATREIVNEKIQKGEISEGDFDIIICSPAQRGTQTAELIKDAAGAEAPVHSSEYLREVKMPMDEITPEFYEQAENLNEVRERLTQAFLSGEKVDEDVVDAYKRAQRFLTYERRIRKWTERKPLFVSHGIFSRVLRLAIDHHGEDLRDDEIRSMVQQDFLQVKPPKFLEGMRISSSKEGTKIVGLA